ncbi:hypothetical protein CLV63_12455 [Murinocardiopsis flavida]|uniref:Uncharacterized protein n=1 Tax=Murinocardiopsis flavida TaxID=645275 RepID=A0A2P8CY94_9ACTN|nr:hypothetical protein [Murinocardiopsis flavida]PSK89951.1 hypothetical protein CLV63_12455 [Murinocardiopsis flavida]
MRRYSATIDARIPAGHDRFTDTTSPYAAHLLDRLIASTAVAIPATRAFRITGWYVAPHARGAVLTIDCGDRDHTAAGHAVRDLLDPAQHTHEALWEPFAAWSFTLIELRDHPANT